MSNLDALARDPAAFHVFHALRVVEAAFAERPRLGRSTRPAEDAVRLGQAPDLAFPTSTLTAFAAPDDAGPGRLETRFFGLFGPNGPLPLHLTEYARDRLRNHHDPTLAAFADIFTHRMLSLFYRAYAAGEPAPSFDRRGDDPFGRWIAALAGYGGREIEERDAMPDLAKRHFAGRLGCGAKNAEGLVAIVAAFFRTRVTLLPFVGGWLELERRDLWRLGARAGLGRTTNVGRRVWSREARFRLRLGPMSLAEFRRLLPGGASLARLDAIVRSYAGDALDWDVNLVLRGDEVPPAALARDATLGHVCWIGRRDPGRDADELRLTPADARSAHGRAPGLGEREGGGG
jgi:type VI secretion system protein ImpH